MFNQAPLKAQAQKWTNHEAKKARMMEEYNHPISFRADQMPIIKISYVVNPNKEATMKITRCDNPLNLVVHPNFRLKTLDFSSQRHHQGSQRLLEDILIKKECTEVLRRVRGGNTLTILLPFEEEQDELKLFFEV
ncbi:hypothetical protein Tco_0339236 [Tanacetum coccineum]